MHTTNVFKMLLSKVMHKLLKWVLCGLERKREILIGMNSFPKYPFRSNIGRLKEKIVLSLHIMQFFTESSEEFGTNI